MHTCDLVTFSIGFIISFIAICQWVKAKKSRQDAHKIMQKYQMALDELNRFMEGKKK